jgi:alkylation response protein AidB-like acyl-CoA dehydrogenase
MELDFTAEQDELRDGVRRMLAAECPPELVREIVDARVAGKPASADGLWKHMAELGWPALTVPEAAGGIGLGAVELAVLVEELGRVLAPGPLLPTVSQYVPAVVETASDEQQAELLGPVAAGERTGSLAVAETGGIFDPASVETTATRSGDGYVLGGTKHFVLEGDAVDELVVVARLEGTSGDDGVGAFAVPADSVECRPISSLDPSRGLATVTLDGVVVPAARVLGDPGPATAAALRRAAEVATVALALESVGTCQAVFDMTLQYAKEREQFGVPIGSFQAIKHRFADMLILLERARSVGYFAALTIAEDDDRRTISTSMAKAAAADAQERMAQQGIQIHGGIGYTWEHPMHLHVRRLKADNALFGGGREHRARVADLLGV